MSFFLQTTRTQIKNAPLLGWGICTPHPKNNNSKKFTVFFEKYKLTIFLIIKSLFYFFSSILAYDF